MRSVGMLVGRGFDTHRSTSAGSGRGLWIAGPYWSVPSSCSEVDATKYEGIEGDSDGDAATHALIDALPAAARLGNIGPLLGVGIDAYGVGTYGIDMLQEIVVYLAPNGYTLASASVVIIDNRPKIGTRRAETEATLSVAVGCPVSVTAITTNHMGFTGRGEGIAAITNVLAEKI